MPLDVADRTQAVVVAVQRGLAHLWILYNPACSLGPKSRYLEDSCLQPANLCLLALTPSGGRTSANWRGPIWFRLNFLIIESLQKFHHYYGDDFTIECPGSGVFMTIDQVAAELAKRLTRIFLKSSEGERPVNALYPRFQKDENFRDYVSMDHLSELYQYNFAHRHP
jgi:hypothetical protein